MGILLVDLGFLSGYISSLAVEDSGKRPVICCYIIVSRLLTVEENRSWPSIFPIRFKRICQAYPYFRCMRAPERDLTKHTATLQPD